MKNLLQTQSIAWAQGIRVALEAEGIECKVLNEFDRGLGMMPWIPVRVMVLNDDDVERAQAIVARLAPPKAGPPPPSWRWQKPGCILLVIDVVLIGAWGALLDEYGLGALTYAVAAVVAIVFIGSSLLIMLGPRADKGTS
jgi:Putative prokaryotic signal transducing protein